MNRREPPRDRDHHHTMPRFSVTLSDESNEWVEREADARDRSKSQIVAAVVDAAREGEFDPFGEPNHTGSDRFNELEERVAELERRVGVTDDVDPGTESGEEPPTSAESAPSGRRVESPAGETDTHTRGPRDADESDVDGDDLAEEMERALEELDVPGRKSSVEQARRDAVRWTWSRLRDEGELSTQELANPAYDRFSDETGYSEGSRYRGYGLWDNCLRDALKELPGVVDPGPRGHVWSFDPDATDDRNAEDVEHGDG